MNTDLIEVRNLCKYFPAGRNDTLKAVDNVSFTIRRGETLGLVGESGCGKTTCGRTVLRLHEPTNGTVLFDGHDVSKFKGAELLDFKKRAQIIFQDPYSSLDPRMTIGEILSEGMEIHFRYSREERRERIADLLRSVGMRPEFAGRFAHELSGGQRQRIGIARALAVEPDFIVCDEPISALDVSIQAQVVNLMIRLQKERGLTYLFISHDLSMVRHISDRIGVMYLGSLVEIADSTDLFRNPQHPYTKMLLEAVPVADPDADRKDARIEGEIPSPINAPSGCKFRTRCPYAADRCAAEAPELTDTGSGHQCACHLGNS